MSAQTPNPRGCDPRVFKWVLAGSLAVTAIYLLVEHRLHVALVLPYLLLLACPLMHLFMHRGHRHGHGHEQHASTATHDPSQSAQAGDSKRLQ